MLGPNEVAYLDLTGSGAETIAHLRENGRTTLMFCAFYGKPNIVRLYGRGHAVPVSAGEAAPLVSHWPIDAGARSVIRVKVTQVSTSCGYAVPQFRYDGERPELLEWAQRKGPEGLDTYRAEHNAASIDGLPALGEC